MVSWDLQRIALSLAYLNTQSQAVCMRPNYIKHPDMLASLLCRSERCTWTGHMYCAHQLQGLSVSSGKAVIDELGRGADFSIN
jgi:hypothetical protein